MHLKITQQFNNRNCIVQKRRYKYKNRQYHKKMLSILRGSVGRNYAMVYNKLRELSLHYDDFREFKSRYLKEFVHQEFMFREIYGCDEKGNLIEVFKQKSYRRKPKVKIRSKRRKFNCVFIEQKVQFFYDDLVREYNKCYDKHLKLSNELIKLEKQKEEDLAKYANITHTANMNRAIKTWVHNHNSMLLESCKRDIKTYSFKLLILVIDLDKLEENDLSEFYRKFPKRSGKENYWRFKNDFK